MFVLSTPQGMQPLPCLALTHRRRFLDKWSRQFPISSFPFSSVSGSMIWLQSTEGVILHLFLVLCAAPSLQAALEWPLLLAEAAPVLSYHIRRGRRKEPTQTHTENVNHDFNSGRHCIFLLYWCWYCWVSTLGRAQSRRALCLSGTFLPLSALSLRADVS